MNDFGQLFAGNQGLSIGLSIFVAVIPAIIGLIYVYKKDRKDKEPLSLLFLLAFGGVLATVVSLVLELMTGFIEGIASSTRGMLFVLLTFASAFLVGIIEEWAKYIFLKKFSWKSKAFNYVFDGIVYAVFVSLGFALAENIMYVFSYGMSVALPRALLTIPAHMSFGVFMGADYGIAKIYDAMGDTHNAQASAKRGLFIAIILHGIYDGLAMTSDIWLFYIAFYAFVVLLDITVYRLIKKRSDDDRSIQGVVRDVTINHY